MTEAQHPSSAMAVANWFLERSRLDPLKPPCDQLKLYKLVYFALGWYMGNTGRNYFQRMSRHGRTAL